MGVYLLLHWKAQVEPLGKTLEQVPAELAKSGYSAIWQEFGSQRNVSSKFPAKHFRLPEAVYPEWHAGRQKSPEEIFPDAGHVPMLPFAGTVLAPAHGLATQENVSTSTPFLQYRDPVGVYPASHSNTHVEPLRRALEQLPDILQ